MFTNVKLENWRNFQSVEVPLARRVFLVGPNASGKSNFLDVFRFLNDLVRLGGGFQEAIEARGGVSSIRSLAARRDPEIAISVSFTDDHGAQWDYSIACTQEQKRSRPVIRRESASRNGNNIFHRPDHDDARDNQRLTSTVIEQVFSNQSSREVADFFGSIQYLHLVPHIVRDPARSLLVDNDPYGSDLLERIASVHASTRKARLRRIVDALRVAVPQLRTLELERDDRGVPHLRGNYEHWRPRGAWQNERQFSDGTLRLFGLLWAAMDGQGPLLLEEPELSLHPEVIRYIPQLLFTIQARGNRQTLLSTHSRDLLADEGIGLNEVLLFYPEQEGTRIATASDSMQIRALLDGGVPLPDIVSPETAPRAAYKVALLTGD